MSSATRASILSSIFVFFGIIESLNGFLYNSYYPVDRNKFFSQYNFCKKKLPKSSFTNNASKVILLALQGKPSPSSTLAVTRQQVDSQGVTVGDTRGATLLLQNVAISRGSNRLLSNVNLRVEQKERWGIVGSNGSGKSTLLGAVMGTVRVDEGIAMVAPKIRVGYLKQTAVAGSRRTVAEEAASGMQELMEAKRAMEEVQRIIENGDYSSDALQRLDLAMERYESAGGYTQEQLVDSVLAGLGFTSEDSNRLCSDFSGGWQMRIALAKLLLSQPSLLLLDEPSNHLDSAARNWLANYLANYDGSLILVSHDLALLEKSVTNIAEVVGYTVIAYGSCNYSRYLEEKAFRAKTAQAEYERNMEEANRLQAFVDRFGASATKAASAQSRVKMLEKMKKEGKLEKPPVAVVASHWKPVLKLPPPIKPMGESLLSLKEVSIGYDPLGTPLLNNISLDITRGMKILLRGKNGAGKSSLMAVLRGKLSALNGKITQNAKLRLGMFTQDLAQELDMNRKGIELVTEYAREGSHGDITISDQDARAVMGALGLSGDKPLRIVGDLSGGEKARVALSMFALKPSNLLLFDEPSNHLDKECIEALGEALDTWGGKDGAILVISHDRSFCEKVGFTHVATVADGTLKIEQRSLCDDDWEQYSLKSDANPLNDEQSKGNVQQLEEEKREIAKRRKLSVNAPRRIAQLEKLICDCEVLINSIDAEALAHGNDVGKLVELTKNKEREQAKVDKMMKEWEELEAIIAEFS